MDSNVELDIVDNNITLITLTQGYNPFAPHNIEGKPSIIHDYCESRIKAGSRRCIWICVKSRGKWIATDIPIAEDAGEAQTIGVYKLREIRGWWRRHSLYSATGVKEVMIRFIDFNKLNNEIGAAVAEFDYERLERDLDKSIEEQPISELYDPIECGVDSLGRSHDSNEFCNNTICDGYDIYCPVQTSRQLSIKRDNYAFLPSMLEYYWQKGIKKDELAFLETSSFITEYEVLKKDTFFDAANPYGKTVYAFKLVEGWRVRYLLCLVAIGLVCSICVIGVATAAHQSIEAGLTAGSYALGLATVLLAVLTLLSAII